MCGARTYACRVHTRVNASCCRVMDQGVAMSPDAARMSACATTQMEFHILTIFPEFFQGPFRHGVVAKAAESGRIAIQIHDLRAWTHDRHRTVDDRPFGGGEGMLLKPEPIFDAVESIWPERTESRRVILLSAQGKRFDQQ